MKINDFLQIILDNDYSVYASGNIGHEQVRVSVNDLGFSICIKPTSSTGVILELNYSYQKPPSGITREPTFEVEIEQIQSFMDAISKKDLIDFYETEKWNRSNIDESQILINVFKNILEDKPIPMEYSFQYITNDEFPKGAIELTEKNDGAVHILDFQQFFTNYGPKKLRVCTDKLGVLIKVNYNNSTKYNSKIPTDFKFNIPAYEISKYPLLKEQNDFKQDYNHTEFDSWLTNIIEHPYVTKKDFPNLLLKHLLKDSLTEQLSNNEEIKKPKVKV
jgi:hypothetical protein